MDIMSPDAVRRPIDPAAEPPTGPDEGEGPHRADGEERPRGSRAPRDLANARWLPFVTTPILVALVIVVWHLYVQWSDASPYVLPPPGEVFEALQGQVTDPYVWRVHVWTTFYESVYGFAFGLLFGVTGGLIMGKFRLAERIGRPFVVAMQVVPKIALVPLFLIWFGFGSTSKVVIAAMLSFFPILTNTTFGVRSIPDGLNDMMTTFGVTGWRRALKLDVPYMLPHVLTGAEVGIIFAIMGAIVGEFLGGDAGLGRYIVNLQSSLQIAQLYGALVILTVFGFIMHSFVAGLRRYLVTWHESSQRM